MNTKEMTREQISVLADGELSENHLDVALAALRRPEAQADWELYHQIGDVLRSDDMATGLSPRFAARMAARLEREPAHMMPMPVNHLPVEGGLAAKRSGRAKPPLRKWAVPGMAAAAAIATAAFIATPQLMVAVQGKPGFSPDSTLVASSGGQAQPVQTVAASNTEQGALVAASIPQGVVLRDPRIDDYLLAHQRFSPSVYSAAQYARAATFATDSNK